MAVKEKTGVFLTYDEHGWPCDPPKARYMAQIGIRADGSIDNIVKFYRFRARAWSHWDRQSFMNAPESVDEARERIGKYLEIIVQQKAEL